ncbi:DUF4335 domain-containing protein [Floridanema evergladense]|uniref:DUF4335 domain-containing protein n=1 Tax=Floridaenema evergladense BLCC-F167 TaxID=3153639 RepID=A0ABV4WHC9_9CYAN
MTTIQRQYSLPNCTLILEGLSETTGGIIQSEMRPVLSILVNAECRLAGYTGPALSGGRDFFESLVTAVSDYAQEILSGLPHQHLENGHVPLVQLRRNGQNLHRLIVQPHNLNAFSHSVTTPTKAIEIDLSTVQLFDLVEAVDQFFADSQTLPSLGLKLTPVEKRFAKSDEDLVKQAAPAALGLSSLALAAIALFFVPIPEVQKPREPLPQNNSGLVSPNSTIPGQPAPTEPPLPPQSNLGGQTTTPLTSSTTEVPVNSPTTPLATQIPPSPVATSTPVTTPIPPTESNSVAQTPVPVPTIPPTESTLGQTPGTNLPPTTPANLSGQTPTNSGVTVDKNNEIVDSTSLKFLNRSLYNQIVKQRREISKFPEELVYRVAIRPDGTVINYEPRNQPARDYLNQTPLSNLGVANVPNSTSVNEPVAYFKVVFTPRGVLQVSPWRGYQ